jgi:hypothetical protein
VAAQAEEEDHDEDEEKQQLATTTHQFSNMFRHEYTLFLESEGRPRAGWYINNGVIYHMFGEEDAFREFLSQARGFVRCGIHTNMATVRGEGTMTLQIELGRTLRVTGVLFVLGMRVSVLSAATLEDQGYGVEFYGHVVHIFSTWREVLGVPVMINHSEGQLYRIWGQPIYNSRRSRGSAGSFLREQEALLSKHTWWEWSQLDEWEYSNGLSATDKGSYSIEEVE